MLDCQAIASNQGKGSGHYVRVQETNKAKKYLLMLRIYRTKLFSKNTLLESVSVSIEIRSSILMIK
ncbi:unnamed protein product [Debaryomyces tyrocola]|nr:unnamed protein product [Debaryomyces tyrocola]